MDVIYYLLDPERVPSAEQCRRALDPKEVEYAIGDVRQQADSLEATLAASMFRELSANTYDGLEKRFKYSRWLLKPSEQQYDTGMPDMVAAIFIMLADMGRKVFEDIRVLANDNTRDEIIVIGQVARRYFHIGQWGDRVTSIAFIN